jgi:putative nucleotidyltransferase with HDIG domain
MSGRVLFATDDPSALRAFRTAFPPQQREWETVVARGGTEALKRLEGDPFDALVADARLSGTPCPDVLLEARRRHPPTARIVLADASSAAELVRLVALAHRVLPKPFDPAELRGCVQRAFALRELLHSPALASVVGRMSSVPALSTVYARIAEELTMPDFSLAAVGDLVSQDVAIAARLIQMANSALVGLRKPTANPYQAVRILGADLTRTLVLAADLFSRYNPQALRPFSIESLWEHSQAVAELAAAIAFDVRADERVVREAALGGLLHDIGQLTLASHLSGPYKEVLSLTRIEGLPNVEAEARVLGTTHAEVGAYLLGLWGLPDGVVEAVAWHHHPGKCPGTAFTALTAVHVADTIVHAETGARPDREYLERIGVLHRLESWAGLWNERREAAPVV